MKKAKTNVFKVSGILVFLLVILSSCASNIEMAQKYYDSGNYEKAIKYSLSTLAEEPSSVEAEQILKNAWNEGKKELEYEIASLYDPNNLDNLEKTLYYYDSLIEFHTMIEKAGRKDLGADSQFVIDGKNQVINQIVKLHKDKGIMLLTNNTKEDAKTAYAHFTRAKELKPNDEDLTSLIEKAKQAAITKIYIAMSSDIGTNFQKEYNSFDSQLLTNSNDMKQILEKILSNNEFIEVISSPNSYFSYDNYNQVSSSARKEGANLLLQIRPKTTAIANLNYSDEMLTELNWKKYTYSLETSLSTEFEYRLLDLSKDSIIAEDTITASFKEDDKYQLNFIGADGGHALNLQNDPTIRYTYKEIPQGMSYSELIYILKYTYKIDIPDYSNEGNLYYAPTTNNGNKIEKRDIERFARGNAFEKLISNHLFFDFDLIQYKDEVDNESYQIVYDDSFGDFKTTANYESDTMCLVDSWMRDKNTHKNIIINILPDFYQTTAPTELANQISNIL